MHKFKVSFLKIIIITASFAAFVFIAALFLFYLQLGPKSDEEIISIIIPEKLENVKVIEKYSDRWSGNCLVFIMRLSEETVKEINDQGISFLNANRQLNNDNLDIWQYSPLSEKMRAEISRQYEAAIKCSEIDKSLKNIAYKSGLEKGNYYSANYNINADYPSIYVLNPKEKLLFYTWHNYY